MKLYLVNFIYLSDDVDAKRQYQLVRVKAKSIAALYEMEAYSQMANDGMTLLDANSVAFAVAEKAMARSAAISDASSFSDTYLITEEEFFHLVLHAPHAEFDEEYEGVGSSAELEEVKKINAIALPVIIAERQLDRAVKILRENLKQVNIGHIYGLHKVLEEQALARRYAVLDAKDNAGEIWDNDPKNYEKEAEYWQLYYAAKDADDSYEKEIAAIREGYHRRTYCTIR